MKKVALLVAINFVLLQNNFSQTTPNLYLGLTPPGEIPEIFAPGTVSLSTRKERVITFSPSGHEIFFAIGDWPNRKTMYIEYKGNTWSEPITTDFSTNRSAEEPFFSLDGNRLYYYAYPASSAVNADLYYIEKTNTSWSDPILLGNSINSSGDEFHPNIVNDGSIYFSDETGKAFRAQFSNGSFQNRVALPSNVNLEENGTFLDHYVAPNENYMIFNSNRTGGFGGADLYISFKNADNSWTNPQNFGNTINTSGSELSADITPDGKYMTYDLNGDIYWVRIDNTIETLRANSGSTLSVTTFPNNLDLQIYPNPSSGKVNILSNKNVLVEIININGQKLVSKSFLNSPNITTVDLTGTSKGIYLLKLTIDKEIIIKKIIIK